MAMFAVYSVPESLLTEDGQPELERLALHLKNAGRLKARTLKLPLGFFITNDTDLTGITAVLKSQPVKLLIENDQTQGGRSRQPVDHVLWYGGLTEITGFHDL